MSAVETGQMTAAAAAAETSVLSRQKTVALSQPQILCVSDTCSMPDTAKSPYLGNPRVTFQTDGTPKSRITVQFQWALPFGELLKNQKNKMAIGSIRQIMDKAPNRGKLSEMGPEW